MEHSPFIEFQQITRRTQTSIFTVLSSVILSRAGLIFRRFPLESVKLFLRPHKKTGKYEYFPAEIYQGIKLLEGNLCKVIETKVPDIEIMSAIKLLPDEVLSIHKLIANRRQILSCC